MKLLDEVGDALTSRARLDTVACTCHVWSSGTNSLCGSAAHFSPMNSHLGPHVTIVHVLTRSRLERLRAKGESLLGVASELRRVAR